MTETHRWNWKLALLVALAVGVAIGAAFLVRENIELLPPWFNLSVGLASIFIGFLNLNIRLRLLKKYRPLIKKNPSVKKKFISVFLLISSLVIFISFLAGPKMYKLLQDDPMTLLYIFIGLFVIMVLDWFYIILVKKIRA